jgi:WD40 repeat protein
MWDAHDYRETRVLHHEDEVWELAFSKDGTQLATGTKIGDVKVWDLASPTLILNGRADGAVDALAFSPDGRELVSGSSDRSILIWDLDARGMRAQTRIFGEQAYCATYTPDGRRILVGTSGKVEVFDARSGAAIVVIPLPRDMTGSVYSLAFAHHSSNLMLASGNGFAIWPTRPDDGGAVCDTRNTSP